MITVTPLLRLMAILAVVVLGRWSLALSAADSQPEQPAIHRGLEELARSADDNEHAWLSKQDHRAYGIAMRKLCEELRRCEPFQPAHGVLLVMMVRRVIEKEAPELLPFKRMALLMVMNGLPASPKGSEHDLVWYRTTVSHLACAVMQQARIQRDVAFIPEELPAGASDDDQERHEKRFAAARRVIAACEQITTGLPESFRLFVGDWYARSPVDARGAEEACLMFGLTRTQQVEALRLVEQQSQVKARQ